MDVIFRALKSVTVNVPNWEIFQTLLTARRVYEPSPEDLVKNMLAIKKKTIRKNANVSEIEIDEEYEKKRYETLIYF